MRIIYIHQYFNALSNVGSTRSYEMARRLVELGHRVDMITSLRNRKILGKKGWFTSNVEGITVHWLPVQYSNTMKYRDRLIAFIKFALFATVKASSIPADIVFASSTPLTIAIPGIAASRRLRIPMVFEVRDLWPEIPIAVKAIKGILPIWAAKALEHIAYKNSARLVALSPGIKDSIVRSGYSADRIDIIPNGADISLFDVPAEAGKKYRSRFPWLQRNPLVVYAGTIGKINGLDYIAHLAAVTLKKDPDVKFLVVGDGGDAVRVKRIAEDLGVLGANLFMLDAISKKEVPLLLSAADITISTVINLRELWSNSANKFFDSLAAGRPIAINYRGWQADLLENTGAGVVLDPTSMELASQKLVLSIKNKDWLDRAGRAAKQLALEQFDRNRQAQCLENCFIQATEFKGL